jgi:hypothetical protein
MRRGNALIINEIRICENHNQVSVDVISWQCLAELLHGPLRCGMSRHVVMYDPACPHFHNHEYVEDAECGRYDDKEVAGHDALGVIPDEGHPALLRIRRPPRAAVVAQILAYAARRDTNSQLELEFVGDSGFAPDRIFSSHSADEFPKVAR